MICTTNDGSTDDPGTIVTIGESGLYTFIVKKTSDEITATNTRKHPRQEGDRLSRVLSFFIIRRITTTITGLPPATLISDSAGTATPVHCIVRPLGRRYGPYKNNRFAQFSVLSMVGIRTKSHGTASTRKNQTTAAE